MGVDPRLAKFLPKQLVRFCEGLRYPNAFVISLPTFVIALFLSPFIPVSDIVLTGLGIAMFFLSKARWD